MAQFTFNPITQQFDLIGMTVAEAGAYLKLNQSTHQHVINGAPRFDGNGNDTPAIIIKSGTRLVFDGA